MNFPVLFLSLIYGFLKSFCFFIDISGHKKENDEGNVQLFKIQERKSRN